MQLDVAERLPRTGERQLLIGGAVGVVERCARRPPPGDRAQVLDRQGGREPAPPCVQLRALDGEERRGARGLGRRRSIA